MSLIDERSFPAQGAAIGAATAFAEACCMRAGVAHEDMLRLVLIVEELFTNSVVHGQGGGADAPVQLSLRIEAADILLDYRDAGPPFDPLARLDEALAPLAAGPAARRPGGLGIPLVVRLARDLRYARVEGLNCLHVALARRGG